jgi:hypothetical protein
MFAAVVFAQLKITLLPVELMESKPVVNWL